MPHIKTNAKYKTIKHLIIYVILSPFDNKFFVGRGLEKSLKSNYKDHFNGRISTTKEMFKNSKEQNKIPKMYLLEELETTEAEAYRHIVAWVKYFIDHEFESLNHEKTNEYAQDFMDETADIYDEISEIQLDEIVCDERDLFPNYGAQYRKNKAEKNKIQTDDNRKISFRVTQKEEEEIRKLAEMKGVSVSEYARETLLDGTSVEISFKFMMPYTRELRILRERLNQMIYTIYKTKNYTPSELAFVQRMADKISEHEKQITKELTKTMRQAMKKINAAKKR